MGIKMTPKKFLGAGDNDVKYQEAEIDRFVAILKTNNCNGGGGGGGGGGPCGIQ